MASSCSPTPVTERQITLDKKGDNVFAITLTGSPNKANVFNIALMKRLQDLLDQVEKESKGRGGALIITGRGNFFSAGFDLKALTGKSLADTQKQSPKNPKNKRTSTKQGSPTTPEGQDLVNFSWKFLARLLVFPIPTIAVFNGHAFGLGFFIGMACDHRIMIDKRTKKASSFLCLPEVNIGLPLGAGFAALAKSKLPMKALRDSALTGKRWTCHQAKKAGIIDAVVVMDENSSLSTTTQPQNLSWVPSQAYDMAQTLMATSKKGTLGAIKLEIYGDEYSVLNQSKSRL